MSMNPDLVKRVIEWATAAAKEHVGIETHYGRDPNPEWTYGLRDSFKSEFKDIWEDDLYLVIAWSTYESVVSAMANMEARDYLVIFEDCTFLGIREDGAVFKTDRKSAERMTKKEADRAATTYEGSAVVA